MSINNNLVENILPNLNAIKRVINGVFYFWELSVTSDEYLLHVPANDYNGLDPAGNAVYEPYYTYGPINIPTENYDWSTNPDGYEAILKSTIPPETLQTL